MNTRLFILASLLCVMVLSTTPILHADASVSPSGWSVSDKAVTNLAGLFGNPGYQDGAGTNARFNCPNGIAVDGSGNLYVADQLALIRKITTNGVVTTVAGSGQGYQDGTGTNARFNYPSGIAVDGIGNLYVADQNNHLIRKITTNGVVTTVAGSGQGYQDGTGTNARFNYPSGIVVDRSGNLYVADRSNQLIRKVTTNGVVTTVAGLVSWGGWGGAYQDGTGTNARFNAPTGIAVDGSGNLYVADQYNQLIRKVTTNGVVSTIAGLVGNTGYQDGTGTNARFNYPNGIAVDGSGNLYVTDQNSCLIRKITTNGVVTTVVGDTDNTRLSSPSGIAVDLNGALYFSDGSQCIIEIPADRLAPQLTLYGSLVPLSGMVTIPPLIDGKSVGQIADYAFVGLSSISSITIPDSVTNIGNYAFYGCLGLTNIYLPSGLRNIGSFAFQSCSALTNIAMPTGLTNISDYAFYGCTGISSIVIPNSVLGIGNSVFAGCSSLTNISLGNSLSSIGSSAFDSCTALKSISIPDSVCSVGSGAFNNTPNLIQFNASSELKVFLGQVAVALGLNPSAISGIGASNEDQIVTFVRRRLIVDSDFAAAIVNAGLGSVSATNSALSSIATNKTFLRALASNITADPNSYGLMIKTNQSLSFPSLSTQTLPPGKPIVLNAVSSAGLKPVTFSSDNPAVASVSNNLLTIVGAGSTTIRASQAGTWSINALSVAQSLVVNKGIQTLAFPAIPAQTYSTFKTLNLNAISSAKLSNTTYLIGNGSVGVISNNVLLLLGTGTTTLIATNAGNDYYLPASATQTLIVK